MYQTKKKKKKNSTQQNTLASNSRISEYKVNTYERPSIATSYGIRTSELESIPTIIIFKNVEKKKKIIGVVPKFTYRLQHGEIFLEVASKD